MPTLPEESIVILVVKVSLDGAVLKCKLPTEFEVVLSNVIAPPGALVAA